MKNLLDEDLRLILVRPQMSPTRKRLVSVLVIVGFVTVVVFYAHPTLHTHILIMPAGVAYFFAFWLSLIYAFTELRAQGVRAY